MDDSAQDGAVCLICHEGLLTQVPCALRCGHVYHAACCHQWFEKGKGECPQCKAKSNRDQLLLLDFEVGQVQPRSFEEVRRLETASEEERLRILEELRLELEDAESRFREAKEHLDEWREAVQDRKRRRKELDEKAPGLEEELKKLRETREQAMINNARLGVQVDDQNNRQRQLRPRSQDSINEDDGDAREERRKLRAMRPADRARQLHEAVVSARQQEAEANLASREREAAAQELEDELNGLKRMEVSLMKESRKRKEQDELSVEARAPLGERKKASSSAFLLPTTGASVPKKPRQAAPAALPSSESTTASRSGASSAGGDDFGDEDLLYGGVAPRRAAASVLVARPALPALGGRPTAPATAVAALATPARRQNSLQNLFSKRMA